MSCLSLHTQGALYAIATRHPTYILMKHSEFFKQNFSFQEKISSSYTKQTLRYQYLHNQSHPHRRIWRHLIYRRTFYFLHCGQYISGQVEIVRFRYAGTNCTFTFYGDLFLAFSRFSSQFVRLAVSEADSIRGLASSVVSQDTLKHWKGVSLQHTTSHAGCT